MPKERFFSSYVCDCGHQIDFSQNTVGELKQKSKKKCQWLIETCDDLAEEHVIVFDGGEMVDILCSDDSRRQEKTKFTKKQGQYLAFIHQYTNWCMAFPRRNTKCNGILTSVPRLSIRW